MDVVRRDSFLFFATIEFHFGRYSGQNGFVWAQETDSAPEKTTTTKMTLYDIQKRLTTTGSAASKKMWKQVIKNEEFDNIIVLLNESYYPVRDDLCDDIVKVIGEKGSFKWKAFCERVIERMVKKEWLFFWKDDLVSYEDTASGCDEVVYEHMCEQILEEMKEPINTAWVDAKDEKKKELTAMIARMQKELADLDTMV